MEFWPFSTLSQCFPVKALMLLVWSRWNPQLRRSSSEGRWREGGAWRRRQRPRGTPPVYPGSLSGSFWGAAPVCTAHETVPGRPRRVPRDLGPQPGRRTEVGASKPGSTTSEFFSRNLVSTGIVTDRELNLLFFFRLHVMVWKILYCSQVSIEILWLTYYIGRKSSMTYTSYLCRS